MYLMLPRSSKCFACVVLFLFACIASVKADTVIGVDTIKYGKVTSIDKESVSIAEGCNLDLIVKMPADSVRQVVFNSDCKTPRDVPPIHGLNSDLCPDAPNEVFYVVSFTEGRVFASNVQLDASGDLTIAIANSEEKLKGPRSKVQLISRINTCQRYVPRHFRWPKEFKSGTFRD